MATALTARPSLSWLLGCAGFAAGALVNVAGIAAAFAGWGLWIYWVVLTLAVMAGVAAWRSARTRWFGVGLTVGCVADFVVLLVLALSSVQ